MRCGMCGIEFKISSDAKVIGFYYTTVGKDWQIVRFLKNDYPLVFIPPKPCNTLI
jgi:hypothetical protein